MKKLLPIALTFMTSLSFAESRIGQIVKCPEELKGTCRQATAGSISAYDAANKSILISTGGSVSTLEFPLDELQERLAFQYNTTIDEGFYNAETKEWVVFNYSTTYSRKSVVLIPEDQLKDQGLVTEIFSHQFNIHKNTSFDGDKIIVTTDDQKQTLQFKRDTKSIQENIDEGMDQYLKNQNLPDTNLFKISKSIHKKCGTLEKCIEKEKKAISKSLSKEFKAKGNKEAVAYLKDYSPFGYPLNQYREFLEGCVASPLKCGGMVGGNEKAFYRLNHNVDNGSRALSYNLFMPEGFSVIHSYIPLSPMTKAE